MIETINGKAYVKKGDKVYELGGGGSNIITADSVEQLPDPASVPEGTIALVKGEGESGTKVIDMTKYAFEDGTTFNNALVSLVMSGGGELIDYTGRTFWDDLTTDKSVVFAFDLSVMGAGIVAEMPVNTIVKTSGIPVSVCVSFNILNNGIVMRATIYIMTASDGTQTTLSVAVEQVNIPTT